MSAVVALLFAGGGLNAVAQEAPSAKAVVFADIDISNAEILHQDAGTVTVGFDIMNRAATVQEGIRYGIEVRRMMAAGQASVDSLVADETLRLAAGASQYRQLTYRAPEFLSGAYEIWVVSRTQSGVMLGLSKAGAVTFSGTGSYVDIGHASCVLSVGDEEKTYPLGNGVDIGSDEVLTLSCDIRNGRSGTVSVVPVFQTYRRSSFGESVTVPASGQSFDIARGETKGVRFLVPVPSVPQAYDVRMTLHDADGAIISNSVTAHYVVRGISGAIQGATFDAASYAKGDTMTVSGFWTGSADRFPGSRGQGSAIADANIRVLAVGGDGDACASFTGTLDPSQSRFSVSGPVTSDCGEPSSVVVFLLSGDRELDKVVLGADPSSARGVTLNDTEKNRFSSLIPLSLKDILVRVVLVMFLISVIFILLKMNGGKARRGVRSWLVLFALCGMSLYADHASAITWWVGESADAGAWFTVDADKGTYQTGETIQLYGVVEYAHCVNGWGGYAVEAEIEGRDTMLGADFDFYPDAPGNQHIWVTGYLEGTGRAPRIPGQYDIELKGTFFQWGNDITTGEATIPITVVAENRTPTVPVIEGAIIGTVGTEYVFTATSTDPDGDRIRYQFHSGDHWALLPSDHDFVDSGVPQSFSLSWDVPGTYSVLARAKDVPYNHSQWATHTIVISETPPEPQVLTLCIGGSDISPYTLRRGEVRTLSAHYGPDGDCGDTDISGDVTFSDAGSAPVSIDGSVLRADAAGTEAVTAIRVSDGLSDSVSVQVPPSCTYDCAKEEHCPDESYSVPITCDDGTSSGTHDCTGIGVKVCGFNMREVAPGE